MDKKIIFKNVHKKTPWEDEKENKKQKSNIISFALNFFLICFSATLISFCLIGQTYAKFVSKINSNNNVKAAGFYITNGGYKTGESELTTIIAPGQTASANLELTYFSQVPTEFLNVSSKYVVGTGVLADFDALLSEYENYKALHNPNGKAPASLSECFVLTMEETSIAKAIAKELYTNYGLEKLADHAVGPMSDDATIPFTLQIPIAISWVEHNDPDWDTWDTFLGSQFAMSDIETTISIDFQVIAQQIIGDITMPSVPVNVDGVQVGSFHLQDGQTIEQAMNEAQLGITTDNSIGWYLDEDLSQIADNDYVLSEGDQIYTKMATLDKLSISGTTVNAVNKNISGEVVIPKTINGNQITRIPVSAFNGCTEITNVIIPDGVKVIDQFAFSGCTNLQSITIPNTITDIEVYSFNNNTNLTSITIPSNIESISYDAFVGCTSLEYNQYDNAYYLGNENNPYVVLMRAINTSITSCEIHPLTKFLYGSRSTTVSNLGSFRNCNQLTSITLPEGLLEIGEYAFERCSKLTGDIVIPNSVSAVGQSAFSNCSKITGISIGDSLTSIPSNILYGCSNLRTVHIGASLTSIGGSNSLFNRSAQYLTSITVSPQNQTFVVDGNCLINKVKKELIIGYGNFTIPLDLGIETIYDYAFYYVSSNKNELILPSTLKSIGTYAFYYCSGLTGDLIIPSGVTSIGNYAFYYCSGLTGDLIIPSGVTSIGSSAFFNCSSLTGDLVIPTSVTTIGSSAFSNIPFNTITCDQNNTNYVAKNNCLIEVSSKKLIKGSNNSIIPNDGSVTNIAWGAFGNCSGLTGELVIPDSVITIEGYAFYGCSGLTEVVIPASVTSIGTYAFSGATNMQTLIIDSETVATNNTMLNNIGLLMGTAYKDMVIYINDNISGTLGTTLTNNYNKQSSSDKVGYSMWVRK